MLRAPKTLLETVPCVPSMSFLTRHESCHLPLPFSRRQKLSMGLFSSLYKYQSQSSVSKFSKVSSSQGKLNHFVQNSPWRSSSHTSSTNTRRYLCLCVEYIQCHPGLKTTAIIKLRREAQGYEHRGFA